MIEIETITLRDDPLLIERLARAHDRADRAAARVLGAVAHYYRLSPAALTGRGRTGEVAEARQMVMYLMRQGIKWAMARRDADGAFHLAMEPYPYEQIAHHLGRDHSTVMHGWRVIARRRRACKDVVYTVRALIAELSRPPRRTAAREERWMAVVQIRAKMFPCPACGADAVGTIDTLVCRWSADRAGEVVEWSGNELDTQETLERDGRPVLVCKNGHDYTHTAFTAEVMRTLGIEERDND